MGLRFEPCWMERHPLMQTCPDVNVLINAVNPASPQHQAARAYFQTAGSAGMPRSIAGHAIESAPVGDVAAVP